MRTYWIACDAKGFAVPYALSYSKECAEIACTRYYNLPDEAWDDMAERGYTVTEHNTIPAATLDKVREALQALRDEQNGPPLCNREAQWNEAMTMVEAALALLGSEEA